MKVGRSSGLQRRRAAQQATAAMAVNMSTQLAVCGVSDFITTFLEAVKIPDPHCSMLP